MTVSRTLLITTACTLTLILLGGCTTFGRISWRNALILFRSPDSVQHRIVTPERTDARLVALWVGHATVLVQLDDKFILTDPVFTRYVGGVSPRLVEPGVAAENLPHLDAVLVSHRHFDHLSRGSFALFGRKTAVVLTPPGAADDIPAGPYETIELPAWQLWEHDGLRVTAVPVLHSGGRLVADEKSHAKAFTGFVVEYHGMTVFFAGDTSYKEGVFRAIAARFPVVDLALMPIGPIKPETEMLPHHLNPAQALMVSKELGARHMLPIHFGTFIESLDKRGEVEGIFNQAVAEFGELGSEYRPLRIGEQRVYRYR